MGVNLPQVKNHRPAQRFLTRRARALTRPTTKKVWSINLPMNTCFCSFYEVRGAWNKGQLRKGGLAEARLRTIAPAQSGREWSPIITQKVTRVAFVGVTLLNIEEIMKCDEKNDT